MNDLLTQLLSLAFVAQVLRITVPYALAALGGAVVERSGVVDLALEAKLLTGAFTAAVGAYQTDSVAAGALAGVAGGLAVGGLQAVVVLRLRADPIVAGVALNLLSYGATRYLLKILFGSTANSPNTVGFGSGLFGNWLFWLACLCAVAVWLVVGRTRFGLRLRAVGEHPEAAVSAGITVGRVRLGALLLGGAVAGLGGAWLALANHGFVAEMSGGRGYIALAAVIMGGWRPAAACAACLLFGFAEALELNLQAAALGIPRELTQMLPYLLTIIALSGLIGRRRPPAALGRS